MREYTDILNCEQYINTLASTQGTLFMYELENAESKTAQILY